MERGKGLLREPGVTVSELDRSYAVPNDQEIDKPGEMSMEEHKDRVHMAGKLAKSAIDSYAELRDAAADARAQKEGRKGYLPTEISEEELRQMDAATEQARVMVGVREAGIGGKELRLPGDGESITVRTGVSTQTLTPSSSGVKNFILPEDPVGTTAVLTKMPK